MSKYTWLLSAGIFAMATPAYAQPTPAQPDQQPAPTDSPTEQAAVQEGETGNDGAPDIVVTAQGRRQILQDVPLAVSAVSGQSLQNSGANDIRQLNQLAPSLLVSSTGTEANAAPRIRGIGTVGDNPGLESSVAVFIDGVYRSRAGVGMNELGEIERIEVLRGPQGTLFGRNASAGLIHIISRRPEFDFGGNVELTYGNYDYMRGQIGVTGPLSETVAFRLDAVGVRRDGFYDVINAAGGTESRVNNRNRLFTRGQLLFEPNDALSIRLIGDYTRRDESCCGAVYISTAETFDPTPGVPGDFSVAASNRIVNVMTSLGGIIPPNPFDREIVVTPGRSYRGDTTDWGVSAQIDYDLGDVRLTSITAYRDYRSEQPGDIDYGNIDIWYRPDDGDSFRAFRTFTQEVRLQGSAFGGVLDWLVGGYYSNEDLHVRDNIVYGSQWGTFTSCRFITLVSPVAALRDPTRPGCLSAAATSPGQPFSATGALGGAGALLAGGLQRLYTVTNVGDNDANYFQDSRNWAIFTHNIFNISDEVSLTIGLRYTNENKDFRATFNNTNTICPVQQAAFANFLTGGLTPLPGSGVNGNPATSVQALAQGLVNLTCQGNNTAALNSLNLSDERSEDEWSGTAILSYRPNSQFLLYGSYSRGYKAGGFNLDRSALGSPVFAPNDPRNFGPRGAPFGTANLQFDAEIVDAFEVGFKYTRRNFIFNVAAFRQQFSDFQLNTFNGSVFIVQNVNGCATPFAPTTFNNQQMDADNDPSAGTGSCAADDVEHGVTSTGIELETAIYPRRDLQFTGGVTYARTRYQDDLVGRNTGAPLDPSLFLLPGQQLSNAPELVVTSSMAWTPRLGTSGMTGLVYVDQRTSSGYNTGSDLFPEKEQDGFTLVNARLGIRGPQQRWALELWAQNLFNVDYQQVAFNSPVQGGNSRAHVQNWGAGVGNPQVSGSPATQLFSSFLAEPRTFGITGRFRF
ncbi:MAG TPA: TonB-dependent receptor [Allosphingosinicella sp.]|jgi:outer membrane receptor protein involved in Fe transport